MIAIIALLLLAAGAAYFALGFYTRRRKRLLAAREREFELRLEIRHTEEEIEVTRTLLRLADYWIEVFKRELDEEGKSTDG